MPLIMKVGMIYRSKTNGCKLTIMRMDWPWMFSCLNHDSNAISHYSLEELTDRWEFTGYYNKAVKILYVK